MGGGHTLEFALNVILVGEGGQRVHELLEFNLSFLSVSKMAIIRLKRGFPASSGIDQTSSIVGR